MRQVLAAIERGSLPHGSGLIPALSHFLDHASLDRLFRAFADMPCAFCSHGMAPCGACHAAPFHPDSPPCTRCNGFGFDPCEACGGSGLMGFGLVPAPLHFEVARLRSHPALSALAHLRASQPQGDTCHCSCEDLVARYAQATRALGLCTTLTAALAASERGDGPAQPSAPLLLVGLKGATVARREMFWTLDRLALAAASHAHASRDPRSRRAFHDWAALLRIHRDRLRESLRDAHSTLFFHTDRGVECD